LINQSVKQARFYRIFSLVINLVHRQLNFVRCDAAEGYLSVALPAECVRSASPFVPQYSQTSVESEPQQQTACLVPIIWWPPYAGDHGSANRLDQLGRRHVSKQSASLQWAAQDRRAPQLILFIPHDGMYHAAIQDEAEHTIISISISPYVDLEPNDTHSKDKRH